MNRENNSLNKRNKQIESSMEDCPFPANFEEIFLQEFHRRRDEHCFAKIKRWCIRQWDSYDFRWGTFLGGVATGAAIIALVIGFAGNGSGVGAKVADDTINNVDPIKEEVAKTDKGFTSSGGNELTEPDNDAQADLKRQKQ